MIKKTITIIFASIMLNLLVVNFRFAALPTLVPEACRGAAKISECNLTAVEKMIGNAATIILGVSGSLALGVFIYGGLLYIIGGASADYAKKGKDALKYAIIGLIFIMSAGVILKSIMKALAG